MKKLRNYLWTIDPDYFYLKQACKTILAIVISLWIVRDETALTQLLAGIASGFSMEGVVAKNWSARLIRIVGFSAAYFSAFALGLIVRDSANWTAVTLVLLGFIVNYMRRFGLDNSTAPMKIWVLCLLATILPFKQTMEAWSHIYGLVVGLLVSVVIMFVFTENYPRLFLKNANQFFKTLAQGMSEIRQYLLTPDLSENFLDLSFVHLKMTLRQLIDSNQLMEQSSVFQGKEKQINVILTHQYALFNAYSQMVDAYQTLWLSKHQISRPSVLALSKISKQFSRLLSGMNISIDYGVESDSSHIPLPGLAKQLGHTPLTDPALVMVLLNLKLSFDLLRQHIKIMLRECDET